VDLKAIQAFGAQALVTLMETHELADFQVPSATLARETQACAIEWYHIPITDVWVPDERFEDQWTYSGPRLRSMLRSGKHIVLHCRGGLGRTGMIAARLLVEFEDPDAAIRKVRAA
jgi:protein-tyrosine phosphatase